MSEQQQISFSVYGMNCASCASTLTKAFETLPNIQANVNFSLEKASLTFDKTQLSEPLAPAINQILLDKGYQTDYETLVFNADWSCASCVEKTVKALKKHPFVIDVKTNLITKTLYVETLQSLVNAELIQTLIAISPYQLEQKENHSSQQKLVNKQQQEKGLFRREKISLLFALLLSLPFCIAMISMFINDTQLLSPIMQFALASPIQFLIGARFYKGAWQSIKNYTTNMDVLVVLGTSAAYFFSVYSMLSGHHTHLYFESSSLVIVLIRIGKYLEFKAKKSSSQAIASLNQLQAIDAQVKKGKVFKTVLIEQVQVNDLVQIAAGDKVPVDGVIVEGSSYINESLLTGESKPILKNTDDTIYAGTINGDGTLLIKTTAVNEQTKLHHIISLVESAQMSKAPILQLVDKISAVFVPVVLSIALLTFASWMLIDGNFEAALLHSVAVLVIACPCALGLATPTAMVVGTGLAAQKGILIKDLNTLQMAHKLDYIAFDKTGTLTKGKVGLEKVTALDSDFYPILLALQTASKHPIAKAVVEHCQSLEVQPKQLTNIQSIQGEGITATLNGDNVYVGNEKILTRFKVDKATQLATHAINVAEDDNVIYVGYKDTLIGFFLIADQLREQSQQAITDLQKLDLSTLMLSGDKYQVVEKLSSELGLDGFYAQQSPQQKLQHLSRLQQDHLVAMVGDGVNDAPALAQADVSIAMGGGSDVAKHTASMTLMRDDPRLIAVAIKLSRYTWRTIRQNLFWAFIFNTIAIPAAALGYLNPTLAALAMTASSLMVLGNSLRLKTSQSSI